MKYFAFVALFMMLAIQAFALPAAPAPAAAPNAVEVESRPQGQAIEEPHTGAAKDKRALFYYTTSAIVPPAYPTFYRYSVLPSYYPAVPQPLFF